MTNRFKLSIISALATCFVLLGVLPAQGQMLHQPLDKLVEYSTDILVGTIVSVTDGIDASNVPYTEVTLDVSETLRGSVSGRYSFRQFGLLAPRDMGTYTNLNVTLDGWPRYAQGEEVMLFLYKEAALTGLRTTVGLFQGKFNIVNGQITNGINNQGLFDNVRAPLSQLSEEEAKLLSTTKGSLPASAFTSLVRKLAGG